MMWRRPEARFDSASAISKGARDTQEDAIACEFPVGGDSGFAILADGMGGHSAGDIASRHVITQFYAALKFAAEQYADHASALPDIMAHGLESSNVAIRDYVRQHPRLRGMGSTLLCLGLVEARAHWMSIGDSPLYLMRNGELTRLNENHSLAHELDMMVAAGTMDEDDARYHPDRSVLTSAITGAQIAQMDCPDLAFDLKAGDILIAASDGLQFLSDTNISNIVTKHRRKSAADICDRLMTAIAQLDDEDQDNVALSVIKVNHVRPNMSRAALPKPTFRSIRARRPIGGHATDPRSQLS